MPLADADFHDGPTMRLEVCPGEQLAWVYLKPHRVSWGEVLELVDASGFVVTEERHSLMDPQVGACIRYLCQRR